MSLIGIPPIEDLMLPEAVQLESTIHDNMDALRDMNLTMYAQWEWDNLQNLLTEVQDRIGHLTSLLVF